ncbi:MAG: hypothetical protein HYV26_10435 [Candidatus Hydrogenedentes bacterium]|nr:hypothetical protein [Candidatus Hydrogenedentota bacterium]
MLKQWMPLCLLLLGSSVLADPDKEIALETLLRQQAASVDAVRTLYAEYTFRLETTWPTLHTRDGKVEFEGGKVIRGGTSKVWTRGQLVRQVLETNDYYPERDETCLETTETVSNPVYFVRYLKSMHIAELYPVASFINASEAHRAHVNEVLGVNLLHYGFTVGGDGTSLLGIFAHHQKHFPDYFSWKVTGGRNNAPYQLEVWGDDDEGRWRSREIVIDPARGFLITSYRDYRRNGDLRCEITVEPRRVTPYTWFPMKVKDWMEDDRKLEIEVTRIEVNKGIPDSEFTLDTMTFPREETVLNEHTRGGSMTAKGYYRGAWIPKHLWPQEMKQHIDFVMSDLDFSGGGVHSGTWRQGKVTQDTIEPEAVMVVRP